MNLISSTGANIHDGYPKQYLKLTSDQTLLQQTALRPGSIAVASYCADFIDEQ
jgi:hypothetical protein